MQSGLFDGWVSSLVTLAGGLAALAAIFAISRWAIFDAVWPFSPVPGNGTVPAACLQRAGACWPVVASHGRFILFGSYPAGGAWRPLVATILLLGLYLYSFTTRLRGRHLPLLWLGVFACVLLLLDGRYIGLSRVPTDDWGGLVLTLVLATGIILGALPLGIALALARLPSSPRPIRFLATLYVQLLRGIPLISVLLVAAFVLPLLVPAVLVPDRLDRALVALILYNAAYFAEVVRSGLQAQPTGQWEAATALGLSWWQTVSRVIMPQALRMMVAPLVITFITAFKDTSLVLVIGLYDLLTSARTAIADPVWQDYFIEVYVATAGLYFLFCFGMSRLAVHLQASVARAR
ncbi:amino acid ABC transporter permease [Sphingomonas oligophenolica]|uniref:Amino acid ABC transporter permease n=1 Tax=Sphingomonas oligophenolica TaxID=301154 RepID=A0ABU9Y692_9SPHN